MPPVHYLWLIAPRLLPDNGGGPVRSSRLFEARAKVERGNANLEGRSLKEFARVFGRALPIVRLLRDDRDVVPEEILELRVGDALLVRDTPEGLRELASAFGVDVFDRAGAGRFVENDRERSDSCPQTGDPFIRDRGERPHAATARVRARDANRTDTVP